MKKKRIIKIAVAVVAVAFLVLGTKVVSNDDPITASATAFDPATFGVDNFADVQAGVEDRAVDATELADAITADQASAVDEFAVQSSGGPVFSTTLSGVIGEGASGIYEIAVDGMPEGTKVRVQFGPAINGTELRDATGEIEFGQFTNQIDFQNAAAALNEEVKKQVVNDLDVANLQGKTIELTGAFTLLNPAGWLITPVAVDVQ